MPLTSPRPDMPTARGVDPLVTAALATAANTCRQAVVDYGAGLLDDGEMRRMLVRAGVVVTADEVWLLDVAAGRWWRYQGAAPEMADGESADGP